MGVSLYNNEGYKDPVPFQALANMDRESRLNNFMPLVYICSPYSGNVQKNTKKARKYSRFAVDKGAIPLAPHLLLPQFMSEDTERELAIFMDLVILGRCAEVWVFGAETEGMKKEISRAKYKNMKIRYFTEDLKEEERCN